MEGPEKLSTGFKNVPRRKSGTISQHKEAKMAKSSQLSKMQKKKPAILGKVGKISEPQQPARSVVSVSSDFEACRHCERKFPSSLSMLKHERRCPGNREKLTEYYVCDICLKYTFNTIVEWNRHRQLHFEDARFTCPRCDKIFTALAGVENHLPHCRGVSNNGEKKPKPNLIPKTVCPICEPSNSFEDLTSHVLSVHTESVMFVCICGNLSFGRKLHEQHSSVCQSSPKALYACEVCEKFVSSSKKDLFDHKRTKHPPETSCNSKKRVSSNIKPNPPVPPLIQLDPSVLRSLKSETTPGGPTPKSVHPPPPALKRKPMTQPGTHPPEECTKMKHEVAACHENYVNKGYACSKCGKTFFLKGTLRLHSAKCDGKFVFKGQQYNISEKDCSFLLALN